MLSQVLLLTAIVSEIDSLNILVWNPTVGLSHVHFLGKIADVLVNDGHNVTILSPIIDPLVSAGGHKSAAHLVPYQPKYINENDFRKLGMKGGAFWNVPVGSKCLSLEDLKQMIAMLKKLSKGILEDNDFVQMLRSSKFDVGITEIYELSVMGIFEVIGVNKSVAVSAYGMTPYANYIAGIPSYPSFVPGTYSTFGDDMTFWKRLHNFKLDIEMRYHFYFWEQDAWSLFNDAHPGFPDLKELFKRKTGIVLLNVNEFTEAPRPTANIIRYIGGLAIRKPKKLDQDLGELLDKRSQNVLFCLGSFTQAKDMPNWLKKDIISAFESFPNTTFIWKYEGEIDSSMLSPQSNIYTMKWVPQTDLLADRRLSAFITHAGMNSVHEATYFGKPMIAIPLFGDQFRNAENLRRRGLAVMINRPDLNRDTLTAALHEVLSENSTFALKAAMVARHLSGRPALARAETLKWTILSPIIDPLVSAGGHKSAAHLVPYQPKYINENDFRKLGMKGGAFWNVPVGSKCLSLEDLKQMIAMLKKLSKVRADTAKLTPGIPLSCSEVILQKRKTGIVLLNVNEFTEAPRPTADIIRYIGGLAIPKPKELNQDLNDLLNKRSQNVLFSLGSFTQATDMPNWLQRDIISAFESFPNATFIWKYEGEIDSNMLSPQSNIYTMKWVPQADLLGDRKLSAFITHAGMSSVHEATYFGKPMVAIPLFGDQFRNAKNLRRRGLAVMINRPDFNRNTLTAALQEVLSENSTIALKATTVAKHLTGRPDLARAETSKWVKLVAEEGPMDHLILQSRNMSLIQYYNIDVIGYLLAQFAFTLFIIFKTARFIVGKFALLHKCKRD